MIVYLCHTFIPNLLIRLMMITMFSLYKFHKAKNRAQMGRVEAICPV